MDPAPRWPPTERQAWWLDLGACVALFVVGLAGQVAVSAGATLDSAPISPAGVAFAALASGCVWWRRTRPLLTLGALVAIVVVAAGVIRPGLYGVQVGLLFVVACFAVGAWSEHRRWVLAVGAALVGITILGSTATTGVLVATAVALALLALPLVAGTAARSRRRYLEEVERRLAASERSQDERARLAIQDERTRIARELHDVVAHHVSLIGVQAGAARASLGSSPEATRDALASIEQSSRTAVGEMRQIVDVLQPLEGDGRAPQPGMADLGALVARWREAGYAITLHATDIGEVPPTLSLTCFRVVEEALTNVARHSTATSAGVWLRRDAAGIEVAVHDPGPARTGGGAPVGGRGLVGMAERAALFGGTLASGPSADGGFTVVVRLPLVPEPAR